jgi:hypothetical protein
MVMAHGMATAAIPHLLVAYYVNPLLAERLKNLGVPYIDCTGNAYLNAKTIFIYSKGNKPEKKEIFQRARLFKPGGLQVVFALLSNPDFIKLPYRELAIKADVALGTVAWIMKDMQNQGFIIDIGDKHYRLVKRETLLRLWLIGYEQALRPRRLIKRYHAETHDWWMQAKPGQWLWSGEVAAYKMTGYLKPETVTLYTKKLPDQLIFENRLRPDANGEIEIIDPFWNFEFPEKNESLVPPLCVYADLMIRAEAGQPKQQRWCMSDTLIDISKKIEPQKAALLAAIDRVATKTGIQFFIVGAAARDFILQTFYGIRPTRATIDVDIGVSVNSWPRH